MPYPAMAVDQLWRVERMNPIARALFAEFGLHEGGSLLDLMLSPHLPDLVENWPEVAHHAAHRLRTESAAQGGVDILDRAARYLSEVEPPEAPARSPVIPTVFNAGGMRLSLFATISQFGTPEDMTLDDLKIEFWFPADEPTTHALRALAGM